MANLSGSKLVEFVARDTWRQKMFYQNWILPVIYNFKVFEAIKNELLLRTLGFH